ncbi:hypothetical protein MUA27_05800 [Mammaliicoccus sciuri]|uniref:hypothetical protein n=1 Tax=Mammaliicoccus sciuri TaxID=1296 RepID=UPI0021CEF3A9|nr:hypothetical protein [Mammaliicoccus sciuri]UXU79125.1 hypothetical protein MUA27_05800 [Mammaliicoccus sciuri]
MKDIDYKDISDDLLYVSILLNSKVNDDFNNEVEISILEDCIKKLKSTTSNNIDFIPESE